MITFYILAVRFAWRDDWAAVIGSYDKADCEDELESGNYEGCYAVKIITTDHSQASIDKKISDMNISLNRGWLGLTL